MEKNYSELKLAKSETGYQRTVLYQTEAFEIVSIQWSKGDVTSAHNHGDSQCLVLIEDGVFENVLDLGIAKETQVLEVGQVLNTPVRAKHEMRCQSDQGKTLHIYTPKITERADAGCFKVETLSALKKEISLSEPTKMALLKKIMTTLRDHSITTQSPYFMNQLFSGTLPQMLLAEELIGQTKTTMATFEASPAFSTVECEVVESLGRVIGWSVDQRDGVCVAGGSAANFMALHCARQRKFPEYKKQGMNGIKGKIFVSAEAHYSFIKACVALGFGSNTVVTVPTDNRGRMIPQQLDELISASIAQGFTPLMVAATAGTTVLGAFDPIDQLSQICNKNKVWLHVDAAWGGPALFSKQLRPLVCGVEQADSVTFDAHKLFGASLTCSFLLTKHRGLLSEANDVSGGEYLFHSDDSTADRGKFSWQCGRRADAVSFWTIWKSLGTEGLGHFVDRLVGIREQTLDWLMEQNNLQLVAEPDFLNICVRVTPPTNEDPADWSRVVREKLKQENLAMVNYSTDSQGHFLRLILAHPYLQFSHVKQILQWAQEVRVNN